MSPPLSAAAVTVDVCCQSDVGLVRERNEDAALVLDLGRAARIDQEGPHQVELAKRGLLLAVFDGMGGAASGDVASRTATEVVEQRLRLPANEQGAEEDPAVEGERIYHALRQANREIRRLARQDRHCEGMGTTVVVAVLRSDGLLVLVNLGDSRAYLIRDQTIHQITEDQSLSNELLAHGELDSEELARSEYGNVILQALGVNEEVAPASATVALCDGDRLLLCSDGLTDMVTDEEITKVVGEEPEEDLGAACARLIERAKSNGGYDNVTVLLARLKGEGLPCTSTQVPKVEPLRLRALEQALRRQKVLRGLTLAGCALLLMLAIAALIVLFGTAS